MMTLQDTFKIHHDTCILETPRHPRWRASAGGALDLSEVDWWSVCHSIPLSQQVTKSLRTNNNQDSYHKMKLK